MIFLRQSTASQEIPLGRFVDSTDGNTEETALTIANTDIKIWKTGATTLASKNSGGATHIANGEYYCVLDATDTDTIGPMKVAVHVAGALAVQVFCCVLDEAVYDALFGTVALATATNITAAAGITLADNAVAAAKIATGAITAAKFAAGAIDAAAIADGAIDAGALAADAITAAKIADGAIDRATFAPDTGLQPARSATAQAGAAGTITLDASASATTDFYVGAWIFLTGGTGAGQARLCTAYNGTTKVATVAPNWATNPDATSTFAVLPAGQVTGVQGNVTGSVASVTGAVGSVTGSVGSVAAGGITAASIATDAIDSDAIAASAVTEIQSGLSTLDAAGVRSAVGLASANLDTQLGALPTAAEVNAEVVDALNVDTYAEPGQGAPGATVSLAAKIGYLYKFLRNKITQDATTLKVYADDGTTVDQKATVSDDGTTYTRGEIATGP